MANVIITDDPQIGDTVTVNLADVEHVERLLAGFAHDGTYGVIINDHCFSMPIADIYLTVCKIKAEIDIKFQNIVTNIKQEHQND